MPERPLRILQVGTVDTGGGAASVAGNLMRGYRTRGCEAWMAVGRQASDDPHVFVLPDDRRAVYRMTGYASLQQRLKWMAGRSPGTGWGWLSRSLRIATHPRALVEQVSGREDFEFPGTYDLLDLTPARPDVVHCHNLHGGYFDLRALKWLSRQVPTVLTLHDGWLLSGHCAHSFDCERWTTGCGACPDLTIYPAISRDGTADNWIRKHDIYADSRLYVTTPSKWLMGRVEQSMLAPAVEQAQVIPNGVDLSTFRPADRRLVRNRLGIAPEAAMVLLTIGRRESPWGDPRMERAAIAAIAARTGRSGVVFIALGDEKAASPTPPITDAHVRWVAWQEDPKALARYYQAADICLHCARADTFPTTILEALACGTPVVATAVGGIPEQIRSSDLDAIRSNAMTALEDATGLLVPAGDAGAMAEAVIALLSHGPARCRLGDNAARDMRARFGVDRQVECYLAWYRTIIEHWNAYAGSDPEGTPASPAGQNRMAVDRGHPVARGRRQGRQRRDV